MVDVQCHFVRCVQHSESLSLFILHTTLVCEDVALNPCTYLAYPFHTLSSVNKLITSLFSMSVSLFFTLFIIYIGSIVALQCCVSSRCTTKSFS